MRAYNIRVSRFDFVSIRDIQIKRGVNQHGVVNVSGIISDTRIDEYLDMLMEEVWVTVDAADEDGNTQTLMTGMVTNFALDHTANAKILSLEIHSGTYLMDIHHGFRSFQRPDDTYDQILTNINRGYYQAGNISDEKGANSVGSFLLQYRETDWTFIKRLASRLSYTVTPGIEREGCIYYFGSRTGKEYQLDETTEYSVRNCFSEYSLKYEQWVGQNSADTDGSSTADEPESAEQALDGRIYDANSQTPNRAASITASISERVVPTMKKVDSPDGFQKPGQQNSLKAESAVPSERSFRANAGIRDFGSVRKKNPLAERMLKNLNGADRINQAAIKKITGNASEKISAASSAESMPKLSSNLMDNVKKRQFQNALDPNTSNAGKNISTDSMQRLEAKADESSAAQKFSQRISAVAAEGNIMRNGMRNTAEKASGFDQAEQSQEISEEMINNAIGQFMMQELTADILKQQRKAALLYGSDMTEYVVKSREIYDIWDCLILNGNSLYIYKIESNYIGQELVNTYYLRTKRGIETVRTYNQKQTGCSFEAEVMAVTCDMVQVKLHKDANAGQEIMKWFPYSTPYSSPDGAGWYCMPEIGDTVRLHIPDHMEEHGYVISSVHRPTAEDRQKPDHKSIKNKYGKEILFTPTSLVLTNNDGMKIEILDDEGINIVSSKNITITSQENLTISSETASLIMAGTSEVMIQQSGASISMDENINYSGGEFRIH